MDFQRDARPGADRIDFQRSVRPGANRMDFQRNARPGVDRMVFRENDQPEANRPGFMRKNEEPGTKRLAFLKKRINRPEANPLGYMKEKLEKDEKTRKIMLWIFEIVAALIFGSVTAIGLFQSVSMQESSMEPTLSVGSRFLMNRVSYVFGEPDRNDIIVFKTNGSDDAALHISRVIGLPGETVLIMDGRVLIDGSTLKEISDFPSMSTAGAAATPITLADDEYFVLGDNRNNSDDSRYADVGNVNRKYIIGKLWLQVAPVSDFGLIRQ